MLVALLDITAQEERGQEKGPATESEPMTIRVEANHYKAVTSSTSCS